jgi:hypothetical protein
MTAMNGEQTNAEVKDAGRMPARRGERANGEKRAQSAAADAPTNEHTEGTRPSE